MTKTEALAEVTALLRDMYHPGAEFLSIEINVYYPRGVTETGFCSWGEPEKRVPPDAGEIIDRNNEAVRDRAD